MRPTGRRAAGTSRPGAGCGAPLDAAVGLLDHLGSVGEARLASSTAFNHDHKPSTGFSSGAQAGSRSTTSQDRWVFSQPRMAVLRWAAARPTAGWPSPAEEAAQLARDFDQAVGVVGARPDVEGELGAAAPHAVVRFPVAHSSDLAAIAN